MDFILCRRSKFAYIKFFFTCKADTHHSRHEVAKAVQGTFVSSEEKLQELKRNTFHLRFKDMTVNAR